MKEIKCKNCGGTDLKFQFGRYMCEHCGTEYTPDSDDKAANEYYEHFYIENGKLVSYSGYDDHVEIPAGVTRVLEGAFRRKPLKSLKCPPSVTQFDGSLIKCEELEYFEAPGLMEISKELFYQNNTIRTVVLANVKEIPERAFYQCENLEEVVLSNATIVHDYAFYQSGIESIVAPKLQVVGDSAFYGCECLESVSLPKVQRIGAEAFESCESLTAAKLPKLKEIDDDGFAFCENLCEITAPNLEKLGCCGFESAESLEKVCFPKLKTIGTRAFEQCSVLTEVDCSLAVLEPNENGEFDQFLECPKLKSIKLHESVNMKKVSTGEKAGGGCYVATAVYGSYDCPQVWTLRRYRDNKLAETWYGRAFIRTYYAISPTLVKWFGHTEWFKKLWKGKLDKMVAKLQANGYESTPYEDKKW